MRTRDPHRRAFVLDCVSALCAPLFACTAAPQLPPSAPPTGRRPQPPERDFRPSDLAKSDIDVAAEAHAREALSSARLLMEKLYRRNPREWRKGNHASLDAAVARAFDPPAQFRFAELGNARSTDAIVLALRQDYGGDRVFAFGVGIASMIYIAYNEKTEFYLADTLDAQKLYNSARNIEIAAWKLSNTRNARGEVLIVSNEGAGDVQNLSFEREFGKMIAYQDVMADIAAQRTNRVIRRVVQTLATAAFLPI
ncbi:MAG TPA: hypothetical protein VMN56_04810 [Casimicrobiaceae bacterium]|nr:hypothetical protein [Casimicrobiaceae bacterium]